MDKWTDAHTNRGWYRPGLEAGIPGGFRSMSAFIFSLNSISRSSLSRSSRSLASRSRLSRSSSSSNLTHITFTVTVTYTHTYCHTYTQSHAHILSHTQSHTHTYCLSLTHNLHNPLGLETWTLTSTGSAKISVAKSCGVHFWECHINVCRLKKTNQKTLYYKLSAVPTYCIRSNGVRVKKKL